MTRRLTASLALALMGVCWSSTWHQRRAQPVQGAAGLALGSGQAAAGAHCSALPDK